MKKAIILQGWYCKPDTNWYPWLKAELETRGYTAFLPDLPTMHTDAPQMQEQLKFIENLTPIDQETIIIGHSIGSLLALRLAEKHTFNKMFLVAGWDFDDLTEGHKSFWLNKIDHSAIKNHVKDIYCITSDNDPYTTAPTAEAMSKRLNAKFILIPKAGHFTTDKFGISEIPEILDHITNIV